MVLIYRLPHIQTPILISTVSVLTKYVFTGKFKGLLS